MTLEEALKLPDGIYEGIPEDIYHQIPYFSASYARRLIVNPAEAQIPVEDKKTLDIGKAVHALVLEGKDMFKSKFACVPASAPSKPTDRQKTAAKPSQDTLAAIQWWDCFEKANQGKTILTVEDMEIVTGCAKSISVYPCVTQRKMFRGGWSEVTIIYTDSETGIRIKSRLDYLSPNIVDDLKTTSDATSYGFSKTILKFGYHIQAGSYSIAASTVMGVINKVRLCAVCTKPPHQVLVGEFSEAYLNIGQMEFCRALNIEKECRELGFYPNCAIPQSLPSLFEIFNKDGSIRADDDLYEIFDCPSWL